MPQVLASIRPPSTVLRVRGIVPPLLAATLVFGSLHARPVLAEEPTTPLFPADAVVDTLDNGLQIVLLPVDTPGIATVQTWMRVGSGEETVPGLSGFAHFFEHLMFHGSEALPKEAREQQLLELSVTDAWTSATPPSTIWCCRPRTSMALRRSPLSVLTLDADGVRKEASNAVSFAKGASPDRATCRGATAYRSHPYHHSTIGLEADIAAMPDQLAAARRFFTTWYRPENATLVIAGDIEPAATREMIERSFGTWAPGPIPEPWPTAAVEPEQTGLRRAQVVWESGPVNPRLAIAWRTPAYAPGTVDGAALSLLPALLASDVAPLHRKLVDEEQRVRWIWAEAPDHRHPGLFSITMELAEGQDPTEIEAEVLAAVEALVTDTSAEATRRLEMTRARNRREMLLNLDSAHRWAGAYGRASLYGPVPDTLQAEVDAAATVELADVARVVTKWLQPDTGRTVVTLVAPDQAMPPPPPPSAPRFRSKEAPSESLPGCSRRCADLAGRRPARCRSRLPRPRFASSRSPYRVPSPGSPWRCGPEAPTTPSVKRGSQRSPLGCCAKGGPATAPPKPSTSCCFALAPTSPWWWAKSSSRTA